MGRSILGINSQPFGPKKVGKSKGGEQKIWMATSTILFNILIILGFHFVCSGIQGAIGVLIEIKDILKEIERDVSMSQFSPVPRTEEQEKLKERSARMMEDTSALLAKRN